VNIYVNYVSLWCKFYELIGQLTRVNWKCFINHIFIIFFLFYYKMKSIGESEDLKKKKFWSVSNHPPLLPLLAILYLSWSQVRNNRMIISVTFRSLNWIKLKIKSNSIHIEIRKCFLFPFGPLGRVKKNRYDDAAELQLFEFCSHTHAHANMILSHAHAHANMIFNHIVIFNKIENQWRIWYLVNFI
jgi:hypothetical protein